MINNHPANQKWMNTLERESGSGFDELLEAHDVLSRSPDSGMKYDAAWALLYAAQKEDQRSDEVFAQAQTELKAIAEQPVTRLYSWTSPKINLQAEFVSALLPVVRHPHALLDTPQRTENYQHLHDVLAKTLSAAKGDSAEATGLLGEITVASLLWRPMPVSLSRFSTVPAGPMKEARFGTPGVGQFNTDLYAYHPDIHVWRKGRVNLQVKVNHEHERDKRYNADAIVLVGLNEVLYRRVEDEAVNNRHMRFLAAELILRDMRGEDLDIHDHERLLYATAAIYDGVERSIEQKLERRAEAEEARRQKARQKQAQRMVRKAGSLITDTVPSQG